MANADRILILQYSFSTLKKKLMLNKVVTKTFCVRLLDTCRDNLGFKIQNPMEFSCKINWDYLNKTLR